MVVLNITEATERLTANKYGFSKPKNNEKTGGKKIYFRDYGDGGRGNMPEVLFNKTVRCPFELHQGKGKEVDYNGMLNLEISLNEDEHAEEIEYFKSLDAYVKGKVKKDSSDVYGRPLYDAELGFLQHSSLTPDKKVAGRYLLRLKVSKQSTTIYVVTESTNDNITKYRQGTLADIKPGCSVIPLIQHVMIFTSQVKFGVTSGGKKLLVFPQTMNNDQQQQDDDEEEFPFGDNFVVDNTFVDTDNSGTAEASTTSTSASSATSDAAAEPPRKRTRSTRGRKKKTQATNSDALSPLPEQ